MQLQRAFLYFFVDFSEHVTHLDQVFLLPLHVLLPFDFFAVLLLPLELLLPAGELLLFPQLLDDFVASLQLSLELGFSLVFFAPHLHKRDIF